MENALGCSRKQLRMQLHPKLIAARTLCVRVCMCLCVCIYAGGAVCVYAVAGLDPGCEHCF